MYALGVEFIRKVIQGLEFHFDRNRAGLILYSDEANIQFYLDTYSDKQDILETLSVGNVGGKTNTQQALQLMRDSVFQANRGDRRDVPNIVILVTDGESNVQPEMTIPRAQNLKTDGAKVYVVAVGHRVFMNEVNDMASEANDEYVYRVLSTGDVDAQSSNLLDAIC